MLDPKEENEKNLLPTIRAGSYIMLYGARGSGKSTRAFRAIDHLKESFFCIYVTMQFVQPDNFWRSFGTALTSSIPSIHAVDSHEAFVRLFSSSNVQKFFRGKKVVLFIDEYDRLYEVPRKERDEFIRALCGYKHSADTRCLHSVVAIGPSSILKLGVETASPFNVAESVKIQYWTRDQVGTLLRQNNADVIDDIITDIHQRTAGHAGLVCMCGKTIAELDPRMMTDYNLWIRFATTKLVTTTIKNWQTMSKMTTQLALTKSDTNRSQEEIQRAFEARRFLRMVMAGGLKPVEVATKEMIKLGEYLVAEGALVALDSQTFKVPSPLLYALLNYEVLPVDQRRVPDTAAPYFLQDDTVPTIMPKVLECFDVQTMASAYTHAYKMCRMPGVSPEKRAPEEAVYLAEFYSILRAWLPPFVIILPQVNVRGSASSDSRCDVMLYQGEQKCVLEFVANAPLADINAHFKQAHDYATQIGAQQAWLVHFTIAPETDEFKYPTSHAQYPNVNVIHIHHDAPFQVVKTVYPATVRVY